MFRSCCEWVQANQPVSTTGVIAHSARWVTAMNGDLILTNPRVNKSAPTTTIYCIHGTADYNAAFLLVANRLLPKLPDSIEAIHLCAFESRFKGIGIDDFANQLKDKIQANGHQDVILMGHSRGGLVAAYFTENLAQDSHVNVKAVFAICSPFQGADLAKNPLFTWLSTSVAQMQKGSDFLNQLNRKIATSNSRYFYFTAEQDYLVKCPDACPDHDHTDSTRYNRHGHLSIMSSHRMVETIAGQIQALTQPTLTDSPEAAAAASIVSDTCTASTLPPSIRLGD